MEFEIDKMLNYGDKSNKISEELSSMINSKIDKIEELIW